MLKRRPKRQLQPSVHQKGSQLGHHQLRTVQRRAELTKLCVTKSTPMIAVPALFSMTNMKQVMIGFLMLVADGYMKIV